MQREAPERFSQAASELTARIRDGEHAAYELLYRMEFLNLVHFAGSYLQDRGKAEDIAQETLASLWEHRKALDPGRNVRALLFTIARNKTLDELRRRKFFDLQPLAEDYITLLQDNSVEEYISGLELSSLMKKVWDSLPAKIADTFSTSRHDGLKNKEIALRDGISEKTVEYRIRRALKEFKIILKHF